jgi:hypothetical protein
MKDFAVFVLVLNFIDEFVLEAMAELFFARAVRPNFAFEFTITSGIGFLLVSRLPHTVVNGHQDDHDCADNDVYDH